MERDEGADQDEGGHDDMENEGPMAGDEPTTKSELYKMYGGSGPVAMAHVFSQDDFLEIQGILIIALTEPIEAEYQADLRAMQDGPKKMGIWSARRSQGTTHWKKTCANILQVLQTQPLYKRLRFTPTSQGMGDSYRGALAEEETRVVKQMWGLGLEAISQYVCTHVMYTYNLPHSFAVFLLEDPTERAEAVASIREVVEAVLVANELILAGQATEELKECVMDLGWPKTQVSLEMMALLLQCDFNPNDFRCIRLAQTIFRGSSTTKDSLENVFSHMRNISLKANKNQRMSNLSRWFYATTSSSPCTGGHPALLPTREDLRRYIQKPPRFGHKVLFDMRTTMLPKTEKFEVTAANVGHQKWRPAGPLSHQRAAAAACVLTSMAPSGFRGIESSWTGSFGPKSPQATPPGIRG